MSDPSLRELETRVASMENLAKERDKWYAERDRDRQAGVEKALTAAKEQTASSFAASKEAILKAEEAQRAYNTSHNDLARKMDEQNKATMPRRETEERFRGLEEKIHEIKTAFASGTSMNVGGREVKADARANIAIAVSVIGMLVTLALLLVRGVG
jgi:hypothetical protein